MLNTWWQDGVITLNGLHIETADPKESQNWSVGQHHRKNVLQRGLK